jgi:hypothetical protein
MEDAPKLQDDAPTTSGLASLTRFERIFLIATVIVVMGIFVVLAVIQGATPHSILSGIWAARFMLLCLAPVVLVGLVLAWLELKVYS